MNSGPVSEVDAGLADGLEAAVEFDGPSAVAVGEEAALLFLADAALGGVLLVAGQGPGSAVEGVDLVGDGLIFLGDGPVGDLGVAHRHAEGAVAEEVSDGLDSHAAVDGLGGQGVAELVGCDVADPGGFGHPVENPADNVAVDGPAMSVQEQAEIVGWFPGGPVG